MVQRQGDRVRVPDPHTSGDYRLLIAARVVRAFAFGGAAVLVALLLRARNLSAGQIGVVLGIGLLSGSLSSLGFAAISGRFGRRVALAVAGLLMAVAGAIMAVASQPWLLALAGVTGMLGISNIDLGGFAAVEQAVLAESLTARERNVGFARYSVSGGLAAAAGSLAAGLATDLARLQTAFALYAAAGLLTSGLALLLSDRVEAPEPGAVLTRASMRPVAVLSGLFALDAFAGGFVVQSIIAYWLVVRFGAGAGVLGPMFAVLVLVQAASYEVAGRLANRIGLIRTMVFTHLPSNVLLMLVPFAPSLGWAILVLAARSSISRMDVPTRQAYVVSIVPSAERAGAIAVTGAVRGVAQAVGPVLAGAAIGGAALGLPFFVGGGLKIVYDLGLYRLFSARQAQYEGQPGAETTTNARIGPA